MFTQIKNITDGMKMIKGCVVLFNLIKGKFGIFSNVDEYTHSINYTFEGTVNNYPNVIDVIYNPDNPNEFWYDDTVFDNM